MKAGLLLACVVIQGVLSQGAWALAPCQSNTAVGHWCQIGIDALRPTQGGVGQLLVDETQIALAGRSAKRLDSVMKKRGLPVVIAPDGGYWLVDHHYLAKALWQLRVKQARVKVIGRLQDESNFWSQMQNNHWAWLKDDKGRPLTPQQLPASIGDMPDYPYATLAGMLQHAGYYRKNERAYFIEFSWARWLGKQMGWAPVDRANLPARVQQAKRLACGSEAKGLPGYPGKQCVFHPSKAGA